MKYRQRKAELYVIIADLHALGYRQTDIGRAVGLTAERVRQILSIAGLTPPRLHSLDDLPQGFRQRIENLRSAR